MRPHDDFIPDLPDDLGADELDDLLMQRAGFAAVLVVTVLAVVALVVGGWRGWW